MPFVSRNVVERSTQKGYHSNFNDQFIFLSLSLASAMLIVPSELFQTCLLTSRLQKSAVNTTRLYSGTAGTSSVEIQTYTELTCGIEEVV